MPFHETTLPNGLRVIAELNDSARSVATGFFVNAGDNIPGVNFSATTGIVFAGIT